MAEVDDERAHRCARAAHTVGRSRRLAPARAHPSETRISGTLNVRSESGGAVNRRSGAPDPVVVAAAVVLGAKDALPISR
eukprot:gene56079-396_t